MAEQQTMESLGFVGFFYNDGNYEHLVYEKGQGPKVIVMHELPGLVEPVTNFANRLVDAGFHVYLPLLFGIPLERAPTKNLIKLCVSKEFGRLKANVSAPVCDWLRALARRLGEQQAHPKIGVIGMCVTGAFVIPLVLETGVSAGVISQPAIPFSLTYLLTGVGKGPWMHRLNIAANDLAEAANRAARDNTRLIIQRFCDDRLCPHSRVDLIASSFGPNAQLYEYPAPASNSKSPHALLTEEYDKAVNDPNNPTRIALQRVIAFLKKNTA